MMLRASRPSVTAFATLMAILVVTSGLGQSPRAEAKPCRSSIAPDWERIELPKFEVSPHFAETGAEVVAVDRSDPRSIFVAGGVELFHSTDSGCRWKKIFPTQAETGIVDCARLDDAAGDVSPG